VREANNKVRPLTGTTSGASVCIAMTSASVYRIDIFICSRHADGTFKESRRSVKEAVRTPTGLVEGNLTPNRISIR